MVHRFSVIRCEPSVPCLSRFVYGMDKVELSEYLEMKATVIYGYERWLATSSKAHRTCA